MFTVKSVLHLDSGWRVTFQNAKLKKQHRVKFRQLMDVVTVESEVNNGAFLPVWQDHYPTFVNRLGLDLSSCEQFFRSFKENTLSLNESLVAHAIACSKGWKI